MKPLDLTKPVQTKDGKPARILATNSKCTCAEVSQPLVVEVETQYGPQVFTYTIDGQFYARMPSVSDLINVPAKIKLTGFLNVYNDSDICFNKTRTEADTYKGAGRIACVDLSKFNIEVTEGEGL